MDTTHSDSSEAEKQARSFLCWGSRLFFVSCYAADCLISRLGCWTMLARGCERKDSAAPRRCTPRFARRGREPCPHVHDDYSIIDSKLIKLALSGLFIE